MNNLSVFLLSLILFGSGAVAGAYVQYHRDFSQLTRPDPTIHCFLIYNGTLPTWLHQYIPVVPNGKYEVYQC